MANKPEIKRKKKERTHSGKEEEKREKQTKTTFWKEWEMSVSNVIRVHDTIHSADNNTERMTGSLNI